MAATIEKQSTAVISPVAVDFADIPHSFESVAHQVERGLNSLKRTSHYLRKVCDAKIAYYTQIQKLSRAEMVNPVKDEHGNMPRFNKAFESMTSSLTALAEKENMMGLLLMKEVVEQIDACIESTTVTRKAILSEEKKATSSLRAMYDSKTKQRGALLKAIEELKTERERERLAALAPPTSWQDKAKAKVAATLKKDPEKMRKDIYDLAVAYKECVKDANLHQTKYYQEELPAIMAKMQRLETTRLGMMETVFNRLVQVHSSAYDKCLDDCSAWLKTLALMDKSMDVSDFVDGVIVLNGSALPPLQFSYDITVSPDDIKANRLDGVPEKSVFNKTLNALMALQQVTHPVLDVPVTLHKLIETIRLKGGLAREGIFRNPPRQEELDECRKLMENGADVSNVKFSDVDVPASLLKAWLRDLAEPIVPHDKFKEAIELCQISNYSNAQIKAFIKTWPVINQRVFEVLADLLDDLSSAANAPYTKMTLPSLGIVFAPCLMKNPSEDVLELMNSSKYEARFVGIALAAMVDREELWKTVLAERQLQEAKQKAKLEQLVKDREEAFALLQAEQEKASKETRVVREDVAFERLLNERDKEEKVADTERAKIAMEEERRLRREQRRKEDAEIAQKLATPEGRAELERRDAEKKEQERKEQEEVARKEFEKKEQERRELEQRELERQALEAKKELEKREAELLRQAEAARLEALKLEVARLEQQAKEDAAKKALTEKTAHNPPPPPVPSPRSAPDPPPTPKTNLESTSKSDPPPPPQTPTASSSTPKHVEPSNGRMSMQEAKKEGEEIAALKKSKKPPPPAPKDIGKSAPPSIDSDQIHPPSHTTSIDVSSQEEQQQASGSNELVHVSRPAASVSRKKPSPPQFHSPDSLSTAKEETEEESNIDLNKEILSAQDTVSKPEETQPANELNKDVLTSPATPKSQLPVEDKKSNEEKDGDAPAYVVPPAVSLGDLLAKDANDEDMQKYKRSLIPTAQPVEPSNPSKVIPNAVVLRVPDRPDVVVSVKDLETVKITLKEAVNFSIGIRFFVQHDITSCIQWTNEVVRMKVPVGKKIFRLGARAPQTDFYSFFMPEETAPNGIMGRGVYSCVARLFDDDTTYGTFKYSFEVKKDWD